MRPGAPVTRGSAVVLESGESVILPPGMAKAYQKGYDRGLGANRCPHQQAEPVTLTTGEQVACICIACLDQLEPYWIDRQRLTAEREAYCTHEDMVEITGFGKAYGEHICTGCSSRRTDSTPRH